MKTNPNLTEIAKNLKPVHDPSKSIKIDKTCNNCADTIVCYGLEEPETPDKAKNCPDWHLDFMVYQDLIEEAAANIEHTK